MLKIKDNVDLKKLEKFGFIKQYYGGHIQYIKIYKRGFSHEKIAIKEDKSIEVYANKILDVLYDLIKADLVEKVEEKNK